MLFMYILNSDINRTSNASCPIFASRVHELAWLIKVPLLSAVYVVGPFGVCVACMFHTPKR